MNIRIGLWITVCCAICQGCSPLANCARTLICEPIEYCRRLDAAADCKKGYALANEYWAKFVASCPQAGFSEGFEKGFKDGFADYLYAGGAGNPPPMPPRCYWRHKYETPEGHQIIEDWYAGFRQGSAAAQESGLRSLMTIPASAALPGRMPMMPQSTMIQAPVAEPLPSPAELPPNLPQAPAVPIPPPPLPQSMLSPVNSPASPVIVSTVADPVPQAIPGVNWRPGSP